MADDAVDTDILGTDEPKLEPVDTNVLTDDDKDTGDVKVIDGDDTKDDSKDDSKVDKDADKDDTTSDAPASYELPDGMELSAEETASVNELFTGELTPQRVIDFMVAQAKEGHTEQEDSHNQLVQGWANECRNDEKFGGDDFAKSQGIAKAAIDAFGSKELKAVLNETGMKANPELFRFMVKVGKTLKEDDPGGLGGQHHSEKSTVETLYPNDNNNKNT